MRLHAFLLPALLLTAGPRALPAQTPDAWEDLVAGLRAESLRPSPPWSFVQVEGRSRRSLVTEILLAARAPRDLVYQAAPEEALKALGRRSGAEPPPEWALVDPSGEVRLQGRGEPDPKAVLEAMEAGGWRPRWERRGAFLREHPEQGDAVLDGVREAGQRFFWMRILVEAKRQKGSAISMSWRPGEPPDPEVAKALATPFGDAQVVRPCVDMVERFIRLPEGDPERGRSWNELWGLAMGGAQSSPSVLEALRLLMRGVESDLRRDPARQAYWRVWQGLARLVPEADAETLVAGLEPAPGTPWPAPGAVEAILERLEPEKALARVEAELSGPGDRMARLKAWGPAKLDALLALKRYEEAKQWILEARRLDGGVLGGYPLSFRLDDQDPHEAELQAALDQAMPVSPAAETRGPARLIVFGEPGAADLASLARHAEFDAWGREEFSLETADGRTERTLRAQLSLPSTVRWVLLGRGGAPLGQGAEAPEAPKVATLLRGEAPPLLEQLEAFLRTHPDHRQAMERRVELLAERMPHPRLELKLAQACAALGEAPILRTESFTPQLPLWEAAARRALPQAEARLSRWPESPDAWMAWMDWQSVQPRPESPLARLRSLAVWKSTEHGGPGPLPLEVAAAVAQRLEQARRWADLAEWGLHQWEGGWRQALGWGRKPPADERPSEREEREKVRKAFATLATATLRGLQLSGRRAEARMVQEELKGGEGGLLAGMGREKR